LISAPSLGVYYCQQFDSVCLSRCPSVPLSVTLRIASSFLFLCGIEPLFGRHFSMCPSTKRSSIFYLCPPNAQNLLPKICTKSPISRLVWQIDRICLGIPGGFRGWQIQWNHAKCCAADPCCHGNEIWARCGDPVAYRLVTVFACVTQRYGTCIILLFTRRHAGRCHDISLPKSTKVQPWLNDTQKTWFNHCIFWKGVPYSSYTGVRIRAYTEPVG